MTTINDLDERITDLEQWIYDTDKTIEALIENQMTLAYRYNEIVLYLNKLFNTPFDPIDINEEE